MELKDLVTPEAVIANAKPAGKRQALRDLAHRAAEVTPLGEKLVLDTFLERERLGSTGVGGGVAIPHGKFESIDRMHGVFMSLAKPIDFESVDREPVDLIFALLAPMDAGADHLKALARVARLFRNKPVVAKLRAGGDAHALYAILTEMAASSSAA